VRAGAGAAPVEVPTIQPVASSPPEAAPPLAFGEVQRFQRMMFDVMTHSWTQWASVLGTLVSLGDGLGVSRKMARQDNPLELIRANLRPATWGEKPATQGAKGSLTYPAQRGQAQRHAEAGQWAMASAEPKPRRKRESKARSAAHGSRK
jgi:hypothetical protein